jgi:hypothetical protein
MPLSVLAMTRHYLLMRRCLLGFLLLAVLGAAAFGAPAAGARSAGARSAGAGSAGAGSARARSARARSAGAGSAGARSARAGSCGGFYARRSHAAILALDPRRHAPRVFAMQYKQEAHNVVSYANFRTKIDCMLRRYVLGHLAAGRPNVVVFNEDIGLAVLGIGSRGASARSLFTDPAGGGAIGALNRIEAAYAGPLAAYRKRLHGLGGLDEAFVAGTDTIVRGFMGTFSSLAKRYRIYMIGSADVAPFVQSSSGADLAAFADPDLHPRPRSVYVASSPHVYNEVFMWGPRNVRSSGPDVLRNVMASNRKVPLTGLEIALGLTPGPRGGPAAVRNLRPHRLPGTSARIGFATSLPAFEWGSPPPGVDPCSDVSRYYMRCLNRLGANLVIQDEANPGKWTGPDGNGIEQWQPLSWMGSTYRTVSDPSVRFDYNVTAMMVGNLADIPFDGQSAITQRGLRGRGCHYIGNSVFVPGEDQTMFRQYAGFKPDFLALAPWVVGDSSRAALRAVGDSLAPGSGSRMEDDYLETALVADLPFPVDRGRRGCAGVG